MAEFTVRYETTCAECWGHVKVGSQARYNDAHAVVHAECPPPVELAASHGVCSTCFMALPATGVCDDCG